VVQQTQIKRDAVKLEECSVCVIAVTSYSIDEPTKGNPRISMNVRSTRKQLLYQLELQRTDMPVARGTVSSLPARALPFHNNADQVVPSQSGADGCTSSVTGRTVRRFMPAGHGIDGTAIVRTLQQRRQDQPEYAMSAGFA